MESSSVFAVIKQYNEDQVFTYTSTNSHLHGTIRPQLTCASFVLWDDVTTTFSCQSPLFEINIELSNAGVYLFSETATGFTITASRPMHIGGTVQVTVDRVGTGE